MKFLEMKWTQRNCIMCVLVITAILLTMYLFRHYTLIEGFDFSMPSSSSISMPSMPDTSSITSSMPSMPDTSSITSSMPSMPSMSSSSGFGSIGPIPVDKWSDQTVTDFKAAYQTNEKKDITDEKLTGLFRVATEDDAKYYIANGKWEWTPYYINCVIDAAKAKMEEDAAKAGKPAPTEEELGHVRNQATAGINMWQKMAPIRAILGSPMLKQMFDSCIGILKESKFIKNISRNIMGQAKDDEKIVIGDNKFLKCDIKQDQTTKQWHNVLNINTMDPTTKAVTREETSFDKLPTLVSGFRFLKDGKTTDGTTPCDCSNIEQCPFALDNEGVSPFYQAYWGVPANSSASSSSASTAAASGDQTAFLKNLKSQLNTMPI